MCIKRDKEECKEKVQNLLNIVTLDSKLTFFSQICRGVVPPPPVAAPGDVKP